MVNGSFLFVWFSSSLTWHRLKLNYRCQKTIFKTAGELDEFFLFAGTISLLDMIVQDKIKINEKNQVETSV